MNAYTRQTYIDRVKPFINKQLIKVLTGQRRVGKSYLLLQLIEYIRQEEPGSTIIHVDKENMDFDFITKLYRYTTDLGKKYRLSIILDLH